ncbi:hypothetical protein VTK56DRAFT_5888 [Thermocarpiscus australiensis]
MSRFDRPLFDHEYGSAPWEARTTFHGADDEDDDDSKDGDDGCFPRAGAFGAAASVIGYGGDLGFAPRSRPGRDRGWLRSRSNSKPTAPLTLTDREKENLKQRLCLPVHRTAVHPRHHPPPPPPPGQYNHHNDHDYPQPRARSLSLSRRSFLGYSSTEDEKESDRDSEWYEGRDEGVATSPGYCYRHERLSLSSPWVPLASSRFGSPSQSRPRSRSCCRGRDRYERSDQVVVGKEMRFGVGMGMSVMDLDLGVGGGGGACGRASPSPRVPPGRSPSYDTYGNGGVVGRKGVSLSPRRRVRTPSNYRPVKSQYNQVHALILTWSFHDLRTEDYTAPPTDDYVSLEEETARLRETLESYGYRVHEFLIPMHRSVENLKTRLKQFCRYAADDALLIIYYHGHGALDDDNELVFSSHDHPKNPEWSQAAAAELYAAMLSGDACPSHGRYDKYQELMKKYERYRPVATVKWDAIRGAVLAAPCDVLLVLDCCAAGAASLRHVHWRPPPGAERYAKHLFAACGFESSTSDDMTAAMCEVLDEWGTPGNIAAATAAADVTGGNGAARRRGGGGGGGGGGDGGSGGGLPGPFLTTKRLHQLMEDKLQKRSVGSQPIFKQLLPQDPEQYITLPNLRERDTVVMGERRGRRGYILA